MPTKNNCDPMKLLRLYLFGIPDNVPEVESNYYYAIVIPKYTSEHLEVSKIIRSL